MVRYHKKHSVETQMVTGQRLRCAFIISIWSSSEMHTREGEVRAKLRPLEDVCCAFFSLVSVCLLSPDLVRTVLRSSKVTEVRWRACRCFWEFGGGKGERVQAAEPQSRKLRVVWQWQPRPLTLRVSVFLPGLSDLSSILPLALPAAARPWLQPHTNGLNKRPAWLGHVFWRNPKEQ